MTFENSAYAINGAQIGAATARRALYAEARQGGIVQKDDLEVSPLDIPGVGIQISEGVGIILNGYQDDPNEVYVASNPSSHTVPSNEMPAANPSARSFIVAVVIGDPDFSQSGHPWMPSEGVPVGQEETFQYVRPTLIEVAAGATSIDATYPALPLARIDIPANTTTITGAMIHDLRTLASPRQSQEIFVSPQNTYESKNRRIATDTYSDWGVADFAPSVKIPIWAKRAIVVASVNGVLLSNSSQNVRGAVRAQLGAVSGPVTGFDFPARVGAARDNLQCAGEYDLTGAEGLVANLRLEGYQNIPSSPSNDQRLTLTNGAQVIYDVRFFEQ